MLSISGRYRRTSVILMAALLTVAMAFLYFANRLPAIPQRTLRIGFEQNPPLQFHTPDGLAGLGVEAVSEAAKRAGVRIQWVETLATSEAAFRRGLVDLWPVMADLPERRRIIHFSRPWLHSGHTLLVRSGSLIPDRDFAGRLGVFRLPLHVRMAQRRFPSAQLIQFPVATEVLSELCKGTVTAGFLEFRTALSALQARPAECAALSIRTHILPDLTNQLAVASTFEAAGAADRIRREIGGMFRDGSMALIMAKYSYYGLDDTWAAYDSMEAAQRARWLAFGVSSLTILLAVIIWRAFSARQHRRAEAALRESEQRFRNMADMAPVMIWVTDADKLCTFVNQGWLTFVGRTMEQELGNGWAESVHPDDLTRCLSTFATSFDARLTFQMEFRSRRKDGEYRWLLDCGTPRFTMDGVFAGYIGCCTDITDVRRTQQEALARQKWESLGVLAGGVAHDFNNLMGSVLTNSELVLSELPFGSTAYDGVESIKNVAERAAEIVRQMMAYAGEENTAFEPVDVSRLVNEMLQLLKVSISKRARLTVDLPENLPAVRANPVRLRQVVMNLITNASEALGEEEGVISVILTKVGSGASALSDSTPNFLQNVRLRLTVSDTGCGMTEEIQGRIFDPFFTTKFTGRGLGLAAVQGIIRDHGGTINVVSTPSQGSRFEVLLPCTSEPAGDRDTLVRGEVGCVHGTVLLVEDEDALRLAVSKMLPKRGYSVIEASNGRAGVDLFRANEREIDVVLLDLTMPGMNGREVLEELRRTRPDVRVIITSAYSQDAAVKAIGGQQQWIYLRKPYQISELVDLLRNACLCKQSSG